MKAIEKVREEIRTIVRDFDVELVSATRNIQCSVDVELDHPIYYVEQEKMVKKIRAIEGVTINDIYYRDV